MEDGRVSATAWLRIIARTCSHMLESVDWAHAFAEDGFGEQQMLTSRFVLTHLDPLAMLPAEDSEPSAAELPASP